MAHRLGTITRGTTHPNRLRRMDRWMLDAYCALLRSSQQPLVIDLGYGASAVTALELHSRLVKHVRSDIEVVGLEIDPARVTAAAPLVTAGLSFALGGFELANLQPTLVRAANVLRQYDAAEVPDAWRAVASRLAAGGWFVEGTCDEIGRLASWVAIPQLATEPSTFTISLHLGSLAQPSDVAARLPKALIHRNVSGEAVHNFLSELDRAWAANVALVPFGARQRWVATIEALKDQGVPVLSDKARWRLGEVTVPWTYVDRGDSALPSVLPPNCRLRNG